MQRLRTQVSEHNIFRWAGLLLTETFRLAETRHGSAAVNVAERSNDEEMTSRATTPLKNIS
jgi:hypothetical protein